MVIAILCRGVEENLLYATKATCAFLSGDQAGWPSGVSVSVTRVRPVPSTFTMAIW